MQARYLAGTLGRFHTPDEVGADQFVDDPGSWNMYSYVRNNPLSLIDPTGQAAEDCDPKTGLLPDGETFCVVKDEKVKKRPTSVDYDSGQLLGRFFDGRAKRNEEFGPDDKFTQELRRSSYINYFKNLLRRRFNSCDAYARPRDGIAFNFDRSLSEMNLVQQGAILAKDILNFASFGSTGNLAQSALGSYDLKFKVAKVDSQAGNATVAITVRNTMDWNSISRYAPLWPLTENRGVRPSWARGNSFAPINITVDWTEEISFNDTGCVYQ